jgi:hypothetical protein
MTNELKTLKDLEEMNGEHLREPYLVIPKSKLKEEAIKWVKFYRKTTMGVHVNKGRMDVLKRFFNITE